VPLPHEREIVVGQLLPISENELHRSSNDVCALLQVQPGVGCEKEQAGEKSGAPVQQLRRDFWRYTSRGQIENCSALRCSGASVILGVRDRSRDTVNLTRHQRGHEKEIMSWHA